MTESVDSRVAANERVRAAAAPFTGADAAAPVLAAGAVCWKLIDGEVRVLVVRRTRHGDVSIPKGKLERGETLPECAVREIAEETGLSVTLGAPLSMVEYRLPNGRRKLVYYWLTEVDQLAIANSTFASNDEIESLEWLTLAEARESVSYEHDAELISEFGRRLDEGTHRTFAIVVMRHAKAVAREAWHGADATRPLTRRGTDQAASIAHGIAAFRPGKIITSSAARCEATVAPLARITGLSPKTSDGLSQDAWEQGEERVARIVSKRMPPQQSAVLCSHGPLLPAIVAAIANETGTVCDNTLLEASALSPGEFSVFHVATERPRSGLVAVETHAPTA